MADTPVNEVVNLDAILDGLSSPTSSDVFSATEPFSDSAVAASAVRRAMASAASLNVTRKWLPEAAGATLITALQTGHGFTARGPGTGGSTNLNDTTVPGPFGPQSVTCINGSTSVVGIQKGSFTLDLTAKSVLVWIKYLSGHTSNTPGIILTLSDSGFTNFFLGQQNGPPGATSVAMHDPESGWYCLEFFLNEMTQTGSPTIASITNVRLDINSSGSQGGGAANINVAIGGIATRPLSTTYPNGIVSFTFDDANASDYTLARPTLAAYNLPATCYVIAGSVGATGPTVAQYRQMQDQLGWEIGGHAYTLAAHNTRFENLDAATLAAELANLKGWLKANGFTSESWASPGGTSSTREWLAAKQYFSSHRSAGTVTNWLTKSQQAAPPVRPYDLIAETWDTTLTSTIITFKAGIDKAKAAKAWLIFNLHLVTSAASSGIGISTSDLDAIAAYCVAQGVAVKTVAQILKEVG